MRGEGLRWGLRNGGEFRGAGLEIESELWISSCVFLMFFLFLYICNRLSNGNSTL